MFRTSSLEKFDPVRFSKIARVLLVRPIVPMFVYTKAAASDAVAFGIIDRLGRWVMSQGRFAQVVIGIHDIRRPLAAPNLAGVCLFSGLTRIPYNDPEPHTQTSAKE
jgi:hypothetical protein